MLLAFDEVAIPDLLSCLSRRINKVETTSALLRSTILASSIRSELDVNRWRNLPA